MTIFESISPDKWRLLAKKCAVLVTETTIRPQVYHSWSPPNQFLPAHQYILQDIAVRHPAEPIAEYDFLARYLIDKFIKKAPDTAKKYKHAVYNKKRIEKGLYAKFAHKKNQSFEKEAAISYMLKMEPATDLLYAEISQQAAKYQPNPNVFEQMDSKGIVAHLQTLYEQIITAAINSAKSAHWLDDYDQTYKSVYLTGLESKAGYIKPQ
jgi:hypothetical protein